jgi:hypothetical protein
MHFRFEMNGKSCLAVSGEGAAVPLKTEGEKRPQPAKGHLHSMVEITFGDIRSRVCCCVQVGKCGCIRVTFFSYA